MTGLDTPTRGRTTPGRLRALDDYLCHAESTLLTRHEGPWARAAFVDVGFGEHPWTTLESAAAFRALNPDLLVIGVELDEARAQAAASAHSDTRTHFRQGGFALPLAPDEPTRLVRAMNLLRQGAPERVPEAHQRLAQALLPSGLVVEGSSDTPGAVLVAHLLRRGDGRADLTREALLFHTDFSRGFAPWLFRDWLPRDLRRRVRPGEPLHAFFSAWEAAWTQARAEGHTAPPDAFRESVVGLSSRIPGVTTDPWLLARGYLRWAPPAGVS
ncbi:methylase [Corallococcus sp. H22C18031201]|uniref:methylase n=1 Tax=Citreicoccus inhibens TaxID=2849499 RepID=UPI000E762548|nr:methylase [Citreicoccus inhibens]MBU8895076.1 methylase [Citreicoccus inhibens]RJS27573.1 methylase [Corallococcus sp. H22C18031201]